MHESKQGRQAQEMHQSLGLRDKPVGHGVGQSTLVRAVDQSIDMSSNHVISSLL